MRAACLAAFLAALASAQPAPTPAEQAWAARRIAQAREPGHEAVLLTLAASPDPDVRMAALDALIQTGARLTTEQLAQLPPGPSDERVVLLASAGRDALALVQELTHNQRRLALWTTGANLLLSWRAPGFARSLLSEWTVRTTIFITDSPDPVGSGGSAGSGAGCGGVYSRPGFPPQVYYEVTASGQPGDTLLTTGPIPTYFRRTTVFGFQDLNDDRERLRHLYLAALLNWPPDQLTPRWSAWEQHVWNSLAAFNETVRLITETRQKEYAQLVRLLRERDLLTDDELPGLSSKLALAFQDNLAVQVPPLPPPPNPALLPDWR